MKPEIFAVIWLDFIPLSLTFDTGPAALAYAEGMKERAARAGLDVERMQIRAVHLAAGSDRLETLCA